MAFAIEYLMCNLFCYSENHCFLDIDDVRVFALNQMQQHRNCKAHPFAVEVNHNIFFSHLSFQPSSRNKTFIKFMREKKLLVRLRCDRHLPKSPNEP